MKWVIDANGFVGNINSPKTFFLEEFTPRMLRAFSSCVTDAISLNQKILPVYIESEGGSLLCLNGVLSIIDGARKNGLIIATIVAGQAMSAGAYVFLYGDKGYRFCGESATVMIHGGQLGTQCGKLSDVKSSVDSMYEMDTRLDSKISKHLGKRPDWLKKKLKSKDNTDWFLTAEEAKTEGFADFVHIPTFTVHLEANISIS